MNHKADVQSIINAFNEDRNGTWEGLAQYALLNVLLDISRTLDIIAERLDSR